MRRGEKRRRAKITAKIIFKFVSAFKKAKIKIVIIIRSVAVFKNARY